MTREVSAGGLVTRNFRGRPFVAAIRVKHGTVLALPKGHLDPGENAEQAATREVREETGLHAVLEAPIGEVRYVYRRGGARIHKRVSFFLFRYRSGSVRDHDHEVDSVEWVPLEDAPRLLTYPGEREVAERALNRIAASG